jgi:hypothetical protein
MIDQVIVPNIREAHVKQGKYEGVLLLRAVRNAIHYKAARR